MSAVERLKAAIARGKQRASDEEGGGDDADGGGGGGGAAEEAVLDELPEGEEELDGGDGGGGGGSGGAAAERRRRKRRGKNRGDGEDGGDGGEGGGGGGGGGGGISQDSLEELLSKGGLNLDTDELIDMGIIKDEHRGVDDNEAAAATAAAAAAAAAEARASATGAAADDDGGGGGDDGGGEGGGGGDDGATEDGSAAAAGAEAEDALAAGGDDAGEDAAAADGESDDAATGAAAAAAGGEEEQEEAADGEAEEEGGTEEEAETSRRRGLSLRHRRRLHGQKKRQRRLRRALLTEPLDGGDTDLASSSSDSSGDEEDSSAATVAIPLTLHRRQFFPKDYFKNNGYCPKISKNQRADGCDEGRRRLPRAFELRDELIIKGIAQHLTGGSNSGGGDESITVDPRDSLRLKFKMDMLGALPLEDVAMKYDTCAVVGNSGSVSGGGQGGEIDSAEAVFRINYAPTKGFERDVGSKTHYDVINLQHTKPFVQGRVRTGGTQPEALRGDLRNSSIVLFEVLSPVARYHLYAPLLKRALTQAEKGWADNAKTPATRPLILSPELVAHAHRLWFKVKSSVELATIVAGYRPTKFNSKPMSGWFAVVLAMHTCKKVGWCRLELG